MDFWDPWDDFTALVLCLLRFPTIAVHNFPNFKFCDRNCLKSSRCKRGMESLERIPSKNSIDNHKHHCVHFHQLPMHFRLYWSFCGHQIPILDIWFFKKVDENICRKNVLVESERRIFSYHISYKAWTLWIFWNYAKIFIFKLGRSL